VACADAGLAPSLANMICPHVGTLKSLYQAHRVKKATPFIQQFHENNQTHGANLKLPFFPFFSRFQTVVTPTPIYTLTALGEGLADLALKSSSGSVKARHSQQEPHAQ